MMLKFKPEAIDDFVLKDSAKAITEVFQQIFDTWIKENGKVVYGLIDTNCWTDSPQFYKSTAMSHKALLINIEPIEKCSHPKEKVRPGLWICEGGLKMGPKEIIAQATFF